jgi:hypothetical protein
MIAAARPAPAPSSMAFVRSQLEQVLPVVYTASGEGLSRGAGIIETTSTDVRAQR